MFLSEDFFLKDEWAKKLYHSYAKKMPIIDYHCHLDPKEIYENKNFENITEAWLGGDHYKWRLMRACGVPEEKITGNASDFEKFLAWCQTVPKIIGNPLYTWTHLELKRFFDIDLLVNEENAQEIWDQANKSLATPEFKRREIAKNAHVKVICTTDDPIDDLHYHRLLAEEETELRVLPSFRPDKALNVDREGFEQWVTALAEETEQPITTYTQFVEALGQRVDYFHQHGCRVSDHALDTLRYAEADEEQLEAIFQKALAGKPLEKADIDAYRTETLSRLFQFYHSYKWTMQLHIHAYRNCNTRSLRH
ncbi:glucuronate isomerase [Enterococcus durans]|uniref:Uronate isomerase n=1 Tax=Enterococcus durans TaxID=53345 RepID=A0A377KJ61_9ENTE|nr:glucuronate isomerase [Enterococcus durans]